MKTVSVLRWMVGAALVSFLLLWALLPPQIRNLPATRAYAQNQQNQEQQKKGGKVYTNDDPEFADSGSSSRPSGSPAASADSHSDARNDAKNDGEKLAPFVPTPLEIVDKMLELARVGPNDVVYDLGSGDGRIVIRAAEKYGAHAVGIELMRNLVEDSREKVGEMKLEKLVTIVQGDLMQADLKPASVVTVYLLPDANEKLRPRLEHELRPGTRVVAHDIRIPGWKPAVEEPVMVGNGTHFIFLYIMPEAFKP